MDPWNYIKLLIMLHRIIDSVERGLPAIINSDELDVRGPHSDCALALNISDDAEFASGKDC